METIILDFDEQDNPVLSVQGVKGKSCKTLTASLEAKLGKVVSDTPTREMYESEVSNAERISNRR